MKPKRQPGAWTSTPSYTTTMLSGLSKLGCSFFKGWLWKLEIKCSWKVCQIFDFANCIPSKVAECIFPLAWIQCTNFLLKFSSRFLIRYYCLFTWSWPANTLPARGHACTTALHTHHKNTFAGLKNYRNLVKFYKQKKQRKSFKKTLLLQELVRCEIWHFH
jgi:hypothetical protein